MLETAEWGAGFMCSLQSSVSACGLPDGRMSPELNGGSSWKTTMSDTAKFNDIILFSKSKLIISQSKLQETYIITSIYNRNWELAT